jgi:hypothetical protein
MVARFKLNKATKALPGIGLLGSGSGEAEAKKNAKAEHQILLGEAEYDKY